jgi:hypothetical protein
VKKSAKRLLETALEERSWQPFRFNSLLAAFLAGMDTRSGRFASFGRGSASGSFP